MTITARRYERRGLLAINPRALFESFLVDDAAAGPQNSETGDCVIVDIRGPLVAHADYWCDSYEAIQARVVEACAGPARAVVLRFDSPGGDVTGCFDAAAAIRSACDAAGKQLHAYVEGECASAAYALASQCQSITLSMTAIVGSIGVLSMREDISEMNAARGVRVALVMSGARKGDGHPELPITDAELANSQTIVNSMADVFFDLVATGRGLKPLAVAQLQARTFLGETAVRAGLADAVGPLTTVLALVAGGGTVMAKAKMSYEEVKAMLAEAAEGDDPNAASLKRALAAMDEGSEPDGDEKPKDDKPKDPEPDAAAAASDDAAAKAKAEADEAAKAAAAAGGDEKATAATRTALKALAEVASLKAEIAKRDDATERTKLIASRPDMAADMVAVLERAPLALVREHIASLPALKGGTIANPRVAQSGKPTQGKGQQNGESHLPAAEKSALDARMGLHSEKPGVVETEFKLSLGAYKTV
jgi:ClpP class serine protease